MKKTLIYILALNVLGSSLLVPLIRLDFELRRDYIAKVLCINRDEPITVCGGKCYLNLQLKKASEHQKKEAKSYNRLLKLTFFNQDVEKLTFQYSFVFNEAAFPRFDLSNIPNPFIGKVFRPPQV